jgi:hypothetical protein
VTDPVCVCGRCWRLDRANDPKAWPTIAPPRTWSDGTIRVALPCTIAVVYSMGETVEVESECEFFGHTLAEALSKAARHRRDGTKFCRVAFKHADDFVLPDGVGTR